MAVGTPLKVGDWVEVLTLDEILPTLDESGRLDGMPFMPEMARFCGKRLRVVKSAHKTCDPTGDTNLRAIPDAVHLGVRCDGAAHGGCEAKCLIYWKTSWVKRADGPVTAGGAAVAALEETPALARLQAQTIAPDSDPARPTYVCQATEVVRASRELPVNDLSQYVTDLKTGNISVGDFVYYVGDLVGWSLMARLARKAGIDLSPVPEAAKQKRSGPPASFPLLDLKVGETVEVRSKEEILSTLDENSKYKGLFFDVEMFGHCGKRFEVTAKVGRVISERTGRMFRFKPDCVVLADLHCLGRAHRGRLFCPRSPLWYWREEWLKRPNG